MATQEDIMLMFSAIDNVSNTVSGIGGNVESMASQASRAAASMAIGTSQVSSAVDGLFSSVSGGKSFSDVVFGTSAKAETNKILMSNMSDTAQGAEKLYDHVDKVTNTSLISMQDLIPAMKSFKSATQATDQEMETVTAGMANFGSSVLATTGSVELAQTAMQKLSYGIKGAYAALDQYGITEDSLKNAGWSGKEDDIEGYINAVTKVTGDTKALMNTYTGMGVAIQKEFSVAGKSIGNELLPTIKQLGFAFVDLNDATGGNLAKGILAAGTGLDVFSQTMTTVGTTITGVDQMVRAFKEARTIIGSATSSLQTFNKAQETTNTLMRMGVTAQEINSGASHAGGFGSMASYGSDVFDAEDLVKKSEQMKKGTMGVEKIAEGTKVMGPAASSGAAAAKTSALSLSSLSAGISSMLAPLIQISVVVAIMIPIIAGLVAEALIFIRGIGELVKALNFDSLNLTGAIDGIKQIGQAMWELTAAFAFMTALSGLTVIYSAVNILGGIKDPIKQAVDEIKRIAPLVNELAKIDTIDPGVTTRLRSFAASMKEVASAIKSLDTVSSAQFSWNPLTNYVKAIEQAQSDISQASKVIASMKNISSIDEESIKKLTSVTNSLKNVADAISAMRKVDDSQQTWNPVTNLVKALESAKKDITEASKHLAEYTDLQEVPQGTGDKIKNVASALTSVSEAISAMKKVNDDQQNWNPMTNFISALKSARQDIWDAAAQLRLLGDMPAIPEGAGGKIQRVAWGVNSVSNAISSLSKFNSVDVNMSGVVERVRTARESIWNTAAQLRLLIDMPAIPEGTGEKITKVASVLPSLSSAITALNTFPPVLPNNVNVANGIAQVKSIINQLNTLAGSNVNIGGLLTSVRAALTQLKVSLTAAAGGFRSRGVNISQQLTNGIRAGLAGLRGVLVTPFNSAAAALVSAASTKGREAGNHLKTGFQTGAKGVITATRTEIGAVLSYLASQQSAFYEKGAALGKQLSDGYAANVKLNTPSSTDANSNTTAAAGGPDMANPVHNNASQKQNVKIEIHEGAVQLDARNFTTRESKQMLIQALEGLDCIQNINIRGL